MRRLSLQCFVILVTALIAACSNSPTTPVVNIAGDWLITATIAVHPVAPPGTPLGTFAVVIAQSASQITGTVPAVMGQLTGEITGNDLVFTLVQPDCVFNGRATIDQAQQHFSGFYVYASGSCPSTFQAAFTADRL